MKTPQDIISDEEIIQVHGWANFGDQDKRDVVNQTLLKYACGYTCGYTADCIVREHGLLTAGKTRHQASQLSLKGENYLWAVFGKSSP